MSASKLTSRQYTALLGGVQPARVGRNPKGHKHMEAWDIRRHLTRIFGFGGWDQEILSCDLVTQINIPPVNDTGKPRYTVVYRVTLRLTIRYADGTVMAVFEDGACGDSTNQPSAGDAHDNAMKTALSQALKRCAVNLGDQFGLSLYNDESVEPVMVGTYVPPPVEEVAETETAQELPTAPVKPEPGSDEVHVQLPEPPPPPPPPMVTEAQHKHMHALWRELGYAGDDNRAQRLQIIGKILNSAPPTTSKNLTETQADAVIDKLKAVKADRQKGAAK